MSIEARSVVSPAAAALCASPDFFNSSLNIVNVDTSFCFNQTSYTQGSNNVTICHQYWFTNASNTTAIPPTNETSIDVWVYKSKVDLNNSLPISKPLLVDCPMPVCAFGISGTYASLQRYLIYLNLMLCIIASLSPVLRGVAQIYLATTGISAAAHFITIFKLRHHHVIDMDFLPSLMYFFSGIVATLLWVLLRSTNKVKGYGDVLLLQVYPFLLVHILLVMVLILLREYKQTEPSTVLLESEAAFRLTSICFQDSTGSVSLWTGPVTYAIKQSAELQYLLPSVESYGLPANTFPVSISRTFNGLAIVLGVLVGYTVIMVAMRNRINTLKIYSLSFLQHTPKAFRKLLSPGLAPSRCPEHRLLILGADDLFLLIGTSIDLIAYLCFVVSLEHGIRAHDLPVAELPFQYSQWGTWVTTACIIIATIIVQYRTNNKCDFNRIALDEAALQAQHSAQLSHTSRINILAYRQREQSLPGNAGRAAGRWM